MNRWYIEDGPESDVVISSRVRIARNFKEVPFPSKISIDSAKQVCNIMKSVLPNINNEFSQKIDFLNMENIEPLDKQILVEKHLISPDFMKKSVGSSLIINENENICIMINEEDHLRIQCLFSGMQINNALEICNKIDDIIEESNQYAFNETYGYLTCCPTNIGTGIRASTMLHLPALTMTGYIKGILEACSKLGITVRGLYGENTEAIGNMFQISNQVTLGLSEEEIIENINGITKQIIEQERTLRIELQKQNPYIFEDRIFRALGILSQARIISSEESLKLVSDVRLGVDMKIINNINKLTLNEIMLLIQPGMLQKILGTSLNAAERDIKRAEIIRTKLQSNN